MLIIVSFLYLPSMAQAEDWLSQTSPPFELAFRTGTARFSLSSMAVTDEHAGASLLGGFVRLPYAAGLRATLPVFYGDRLQAGSPTLSLTKAYQRWLGDLKFQLVAEIGLRTPSLGLDTSVAGEEQLATPNWGWHNGVFLRLAHHSGFSISSWYTGEPEFDRFAAGLNYTFLAGGQIGIGIGLASSFSDTQPPPKALAHIAYRPRWFPDASIAVFASTPVKDSEASPPGADSPMVGLAISWDLSLWDTPPANLQVDLGADEHDLLALKTKNAPLALAGFVVPGKVNVFAFEASWCGPCHLVHSELLAIARQRPELHIRTINADAKNRLFEANGGRGLPLMVVFDREGREVGRLTAYHPNAVEALLAKAE